LYELLIQTKVLKKLRLKGQTLDTYFIKSMDNIIIKNENVKREIVELNNKHNDEVYKLKKEISDLIDKNYDMLLTLNILIKKKKDK